MKKRILPLSLIIGLFMGLFMVFTIGFSEGPHDMTIGMVIGYSMMTLAFSSMYFGLISYRNKELNGFISFGRALGTGLLITLLASMIYSLVWTVYTEVSDVDFMAGYREQMIKELNENGASEAEFQAKMKEMDNYDAIYANPFLKFLYTIIEPLPVGIIVAFFCAFMVKRKEVNIE